jgi:ABC-type sugar transport system ATPase subunit
VGSPLDIYANPTSYFVADFFGSPSMNLVAGELNQEDGGPRFRSRRLSLPLPERFRAAVPGAVTLGIRPEHVRTRPGGDGDVTLPVRLVEPLGKDTLLYFNDGTDRAFIAVSEGLAMARLRPGEEVGLALAPEHIFLFGSGGRRITA